MSARTTPPQNIESQAAAWLARRDAGMSPAEKVDFERWRATDPRHDAAVDEIAAAWNAFDRPLATGQGEALRSQLAALGRRDRRRWVAGSAAVLAAAACLAVMIILQRPATDRSSAPVVANAARVIQPERQTLPDGSVVELKHGAEIAVAFTPERRTVILQKGVAHFTVTKNPNRPFVVDTGRVSVRAVGTAFAVDLGRSEVEVLVTEGRVSVDAAPTVPTKTPESSASMSASNNPSLTAFVDANHRTVVSLENATAVPIATVITPAELTERLAWRLPWLDFSETSVADAVAMLNAYNKQQIRTTDTTVATLRVTGLFRSDNLTGFVRALETGFGVRAEYRDNEILLHRGD